MMKKNLLNIPIILLAATLFLSLNNKSSAATENAPTGWQFHQIEKDSSGYFVSTGTDPYILFPQNDSSQNCTLNAVQFSIKFNPMPPRPFYMELFWRTAHQGFSETRKIFFILHPEKKGDVIHFTIPLEHQAGYNQLRLDFPTDLKSSFLIENFAIIPIDALPADTPITETFFNYTAFGTFTPRILIPHLLLTIKHGGIRLTRDPVFLTAWLLLIVMILFAVRLVSRDMLSYRNSEGREKSEEG